jgi:hypothetical protein
MSKKVAILFYGLTRSLDRTYESIKTNILDELSSKNIDYDIFIHTYKINSPYQNTWAGEEVSHYDNDQYKILNAKHIMIEDQDSIIHMQDFENYYFNLGNWTFIDPEPALTKNLIRNLVIALYSKKQITELFEKYKHEYSNVIIMRPDLYIHNKLDIDVMDILDNTNIAIPDAEWFYGCNDRFCIATPDIACFYGKLYYHLLAYSREKSIISERYMLDMLNYANINIIAMDIKYDTLRHVNN